MMRVRVSRMIGMMVAGMGLMMASPSAAQEPDPKAGEIPIWEISFTPDGLSGPGGDILRGEIAKAQFVALGEDHGFADAPHLGRALAAEMRTDGPAYHVAEIGPWSNELVIGAVRMGGVDELQKTLKGKPLALPFVSNREDAELAADFIAPEGPARLWGIDQEFIGAPLLLLAELEQMAPNEDVRTAVRALYDRDEAALASGNQAGLLLASANEAEFAKLREKFAGADEALRIIDAMATSAAIYGHNNKRRFHANNADRIELMHRQFLQRYHEAPEDAPRVLLKMGAYHLGRGTTPTRMFDIGSLLPGLAAANRKTSLHIAFGALSGDQLAIQPSAEGFTVVKPVEDKIITPILEAAGVDLGRMADSGHYLIPLEPLRRRLESKGLRELPTIAKFTALGFDYIVTTKASRPATPLVN